MPKAKHEKKCPEKVPGRGLETNVGVMRSWLNWNDRAARIGRMEYFCSTGGGDSASW